MASTTAEQILSELVHAKSKSRYDQAWAEFMAFLNCDDHQPNEEDYVRYFHHLHKSRGSKSSSLWSIYISLNNNNQRLFGDYLQKWPHIQLLLKQYEVGYIRKTAEIFTPEQILQGLQLPKNSPECILRKCAIALSYCGGLRCYELRELKVQDVLPGKEGMRTMHSHAKQKAEVKKNTFLVPFSSEDNSPCFATAVKKYVLPLKHSITDLQPSAALFHKPNKNGYCKAVMGRNYLSHTGNY